MANIAYLAYKAGQQQKTSMAAFAEHHPDGSLHRLAMDFQQCTVLGEHTRQVSQVVVDMVQYLLDSFALSPAVSQVVESQTDLKPVFQTILSDYLQFLFTFIILYYSLTFAYHRTWNVVHKVMHSAYYA